MKKGIEDEWIADEWFECEHPEGFTEETSSLLLHKKKKIRARTRRTGFYLAPIASEITNRCGKDPSSEPNIWRKRSARSQVL